MTKDGHESIILRPKVGKILEERRIVYFTNGRVLTINDVQEVRIGKTSLRILDGNNRYFILYPQRIDYMEIEKAQIVL